MSYIPYTHIPISDVSLPVNEAFREIADSLAPLIDVLPSTYGGLAQYGGQALSVTSTPQKMPFTSLLPSQNVTADLANDELVIQSTGVYEVTASVNAAVGQSTVLTFELYADAAPTGRTYDLEVIQQANAANVAAATLVELNTGTALSIYVSGSPSRTVTFDNMNFFAKRV